MPLKQEELGVLMTRINVFLPRPEIDELFDLLFDNEVLASVALANISGFAPIPVYEFRWFYDRELPVELGTPQHRAVLKQLGCMWKWERINDVRDDEPYYLGG